MFKNKLLTPCFRIWSQLYNFSVIFGVKLVLYVYLYIRMRYEITPLFIDDDPFFFFFFFCDTVRCALKERLSE